MEGIPNCFETVLMEDNHRYLLSIATLKSELKEACHEYESLSKNVKMLTSGTQSLKNILNDRKSISNKMRLGYFVEKLQWMTILATILDKGSPKILEFATNGYFGFMIPYPSSW